MIISIERAILHSYKINQTYLDKNLICIANTVIKMAINVHN